MKLKNVLKTVGAIAALAAVVPFSHKKNEETGETKTQALLWNVTTKPNAEEEGGKRLITVNIGLPKQDDCCCCDEELPEENLFADLADCGCGCVEPEAEECACTPCECEAEPAAEEPCCACCCEENTAE